MLGKSGFELLAVASLAVASLLITTPAYAQTLGVADTKHNLSTTAPLSNTARLTAGTDRVCIFCHSAHTNAATAAPLWNRANTTSSFTMYASATFDMPHANQPQGVSLACLSCHDGSIAFDQLINGPGSGFFNDAGARPTGWTWFQGWDDMTKVGGVALLGTDLRGDHPISVTYDIVADPAFHPAAQVVAGGLKLYGAGGNQVECASCHNPHEPTLPTFLRKANTESALCTTCHIQ